MWCLLYQCQSTGTAAAAAKPALTTKYQQATSHTNDTFVSSQCVITPIMTHYWQYQLPSCLASLALSPLQDWQQESPVGSNRTVVVKREGSPALVGMTSRETHPISRRHHHPLSSLHSSLPTATLSLLSPLSHTHPCRQPTRSHHTPTNHQSTHYYIKVRLPQKLSRRVAAFAISRLVLAAARECINN